MPNANAPTGLTPRRYRNGAPWNGVARTYFVPATDATPLFVGDPVIINGSGDSMGTPGVTRATAGASNRITGVVVGFRPSAPFQGTSRAASTASYVLVADDPELLFEVQEGVGTALTSDAIGQNFNLAAGAGGNTAVGTSSFYMDNTSGGTAATGQLRLIGIQSRADNTIGQYAKWLVAINLPTETGAAGSLGV